MGPVERLLRDEIRKKGTICLALIDSEDVTPRAAVDLAKHSQESGVSAILIGGSTAVDQIHLDAMVRKIKAAVTSPVILFPSNITGVSPHADAIFFMSLLNSDNPYFITEVQALGALAVKRYGIEAIPTGYIVVGEGGAIGFVGRARGIPQTKPRLAAMYALAAQYFGMRFVYLEAGSGVTSHVSVSLVSEVRRTFDGILVVGGGIRDGTAASNIAKAGADAIVLGTMLEEKSFEAPLRQIVRAVQKH